MRPALVCRVAVRLSVAPGVKTAGPAMAARRTFLTTTIRLSQPSSSSARKDSKVLGTADEAVADVRSGSVLLSSGFGLCGVAGKSTLTPASLPFGWCKCERDCKCVSD